MLRHSESFGGARDKLVHPVKHDDACQGSDGCRDHPRVGPLSGESMRRRQTLATINRISLFTFVTSIRVQFTVCVGQGHLGKRVAQCPSTQLREPSP